MTEEQEAYLGQGEFYWSSSRGKMLIADMHPTHAQAAADKMLREHPEWSLKRVYLALCLQAGSLDVDPTFDRDGEEAF
jgi:hypothetical protein